MDLSLVPTGDLVKELKARSIHFIFGHVVHSEDVSSRAAYFFDYKGCMFTCLGLAQAIEDDLREKVKQIEAQSQAEGG